MKQNILLKTSIIIALLINLPALWGISGMWRYLPLTQISFYLGLFLLVSSAILWKFFQIKQRSILLLLLFASVIMLFPFFLINPVLEILPNYLVIIWSIVSILLLLSPVILKKNFPTHTLVLLFISGLTLLLLPLNLWMLLGIVMFL